MKTSFSGYKKKLIVNWCVFQIATCDIKSLNDLDNINVIARQH